MTEQQTVFVFGSNDLGIHGKGAALFAQQYCGATRGIGEGRQGASYAIPTKTGDLQAKPLDAIAGSVERFLKHAKAHPSTTFDVTRIGCGLAGFTDAQIAPMFARAPSNCRLPHLWVRLLNPSAPPHVIIAGSRTITTERFPTRKIDELLSQLDAPVIISGGAKGVDLCGERYAIDRGLKVERYPANWHRFGRAAGMVRNQHMSWRASHLIAVWDGQSRGTANMIEIAKRDGLKTRLIHVNSVIEAATRLDL